MSGQTSSSGWQAFIHTQGLFMAWLVALVATLGSLYFSEIVGYIPCELCWYQRILMYPLVLILTVAILRKENDIYAYVLPFSSLGIVVSLIHYGQQKGVIGQIGEGCSMIPCTTIYINWFGFITIPFLALLAFMAITILNLLLWKMNRKGV